MVFGTPYFGVILDRLKRTIDYKKNILKDDYQDFG